MAAKTRPNLQLIRPEGRRKPYPGADARRQYWLEQYLAMGSNRSLPKLSQLPSTSPTERTPPLRTLKDWSARFGWGERAAAYDAKLAARVEEKTIERLASQRAQREEVRTQLSSYYQSLILSALQPVEIIDEQEYRRTGRRIVLGTRPKQLRDFAPDEIAMIERLHRMAEHTQLLNDGKPTERVAMEGGAADKPIVVQPLTREDQERLYGRFEELVKEVRGAAERRRKGAAG